MENKVLIKVYIPKMGEEYEVFIPLNKKVDIVIDLLIKAVKELTGGIYVPLNKPMLYDKLSALQYNSNVTVLESGIVNGSEIIMI